MELLVGGVVLAIREELNISCKNWLVLVKKSMILESLTQENFMKGLLEGLI